MSIALALMVGVLYAGGVYMMLQRSIVKLLIGLILLSHGANVLIFGAGGLTRTLAAIVPDGQTAPTAPYANPIPQALILTAIVISFAFLAFAVVLVLRVYRTAKSDDLDTLREDT